MFGKRLLRRVYSEDVEQPLRQTDKSLFKNGKMI